MVDAPFGQFKVGLGGIVEGGWESQWKIYIILSAKVSLQLVFTFVLISHVAPCGLCKFFLQTPLQPRTTLTTISNSASLMTGYILNYVKLAT